MILFEHVTVTYPNATRSVLQNVDFQISEGELALVVGPTGVGKSTLLGAINGLGAAFHGRDVGGPGGRRRQRHEDPQAPGSG